MIDAKSPETTPQPHEKMVTGNPMEPYLTGPKGLKLREAILKIQRRGRNITGLSSEDLDVLKTLYPPETPMKQIIEDLRRKS